MQVSNRLSDVYPEEFLKALADGCNWLVAHDLLEYKTDVFVNTYGGSDSLVKIGLLEYNTLSQKLGYEKRYYDIKEVVPLLDPDTGVGSFILKCSYSVPKGISIKAIPVINWSFTNILPKKQMLKKQDIEMIPEQPKEDINDLISKAYNGITLSVNNSLAEMNKVIYNINNELKDIQEKFSKYHTMNTPSIDEGSGDNETTENPTQGANDGSEEEKTSYQS